MVIKWTPETQEIFRSMQMTEIKNCDYAIRVLWFCVVVTVALATFLAIMSRSPWALLPLIVNVPLFLMMYMVSVERKWHKKALKEITERW